MGVKKTTICHHCCENLLLFHCFAHEFLTRLRPITKTAKKEHFHCLHSNIQRAHTNLEHLQCTKQMCLKHIEKIYKYHIICTVHKNEITYVKSINIHASGHGPFNFKQPLFTPNTTCWVGTWLPKAARSIPAIHVLEPGRGEAIGPERMGPPT